MQTPLGRGIPRVLVDDLFEDLTKRNRQRSYLSQDRIWNTYLEWLSNYVPICMLEYENDSIQWPVDRSFNWPPDERRLRSQHSDAWQLKFEQCMREAQHRYIILQVILGGDHQNAIIVDLEQKTAERYEPYGATSESEYDSEELDAKLVDYFKRFNIRYYAIPATCLFDGLQTWESIYDDEIKKALGPLLGDDAGYCFYFALLYVHMRMSPAFRDLDPISAQYQIREELTKGAEPVSVYIRRFTTWVLGMIFSLEKHMSTSTLVKQRARNEFTKLWDLKGPIEYGDGDYPRIPEYLRRSATTPYGLRDLPGIRSPRIVGTQAPGRRTHGPPIFIVTDQTLTPQFFKMSANRAPDRAWTVYNGATYKREYDPVESRGVWVRDYDGSVPNYQGLDVEAHVWRTRLNSLTPREFQQVAWGFPKDQKVRYRDELYLSTGKLSEIQVERFKRGWYGEGMDNVDPRGNWRLVGIFDPPGSNTFIQRDFFADGHPLATFT